MRMNAQSTALSRKSRAKPAARPRPAPARARASLRGEVTEVFRQAILDAAEAEFGGRGFADAKMTQIAQRAGVAAGTLYNYFDSKESILRALVDMRRKELGDRLRQIALAPGGARDKLLGLTTAVLGFIQSKSAMFSVFEQTGGMTGCYAHGASPTKGERFAPKQLVVFEEIFVQAIREKLVRSELPTRELTEVFTGSLHGLVRGWLLHGQKEPLTERAPFLVNLFLEGAGRN